MKKVVMDCRNMNYPIGIYLTSNLPIMKMMADSIEQLFPLRDDRAIAFWCRGGSGSIISGIVASMLPERQIFINHVKKDGEDSHSTKWYEMNSNHINIVIDDFIRTGKTIESIMDEMKNRNIKADCLCVTGVVSELFLTLHEWEFEYFICSND